MSILTSWRDADSGTGRTLWERVDRFLGQCTMLEYTSPGFAQAIVQSGPADTGCER
jgi:hypothetical protein